MKLIVDSYAWIEFLLAGPRGPEVRRHFEDPNDLISPDIVLAEVARRLAREESDHGTIAGHLRSMTAISTVVPIDPEVALETIEAAQTLRSYAQRTQLSQPSFADAIILAFARRLGARVLTGDRHFEGLSETEWIGA
ncbi:MAG: type II toxin-antitoxin system VapC family toxin [Thermoplasmata archaeon]